MSLHNIGLLANRAVCLGLSKLANKVADFHVEPTAEASPLASIEQLHQPH